MFKNTRIPYLYRLFLLLASLTTFTVLELLVFIEFQNEFTDIIQRYRTWSYQSNLLVLIWLALAIYYNTNENKKDILFGPLKGAITSYITVTVVLWHFVISPTAPPAEGIVILTNIMIHYFLPIAFIVDFLLFDVPSYEWKSIPSWFIFPLVWTGFVMLTGLTGFFRNYLGLPNYVYPFLSINRYGVISVGTFLLFIYIGLLLIAVAYVGISKIKNRSKVLQAN
ncbi:MAG: Pr6Pr family membrane protein [Candidatus Heimdallarchaeota archaeon]